MRTWTRVAVPGAITAVAVAVFAVWAFAGDATRVTAAADQFQTPDGWNLISEEVTGDTNVCLNGGACPSVIRKWSSSETVTTDDVEKALRASGVNAPVNGDCATSCSADGSVDGFTMQIYVQTGDPSHGEQLVTLGVS